VQAESVAQIAQVRALFLEYANSLGFSLCFQSFEKEVAGLPGEYAPPNGRLLLAECEGQSVGCVALHPLAPHICEMKRLYLQPSYRRKLAEAVINEARMVGYKRMRLDTIEPLMKAAVQLYRALGFRAIAPYRPNPIQGAMYMELDL
jgi:GNAT superfamily N-acetyltransferase